MPGLASQQKNLRRDGDLFPDQGNGQAPPAQSCYCPCIRRTRSMPGRDSASRPNQLRNRTASKSRPISTRRPISTGPRRIRLPVAAEFGDAAAGCAVLRPRPLGPLRPHPPSVRKHAYFGLRSAPHRARFGLPNLTGIEVDADAARLGRKTFFRPVSPSLVTSRRHWGRGGFCQDRSERRQSGPGHGGHAAL